MAAPRSSKAVGKPQSARLTSRPWDQPSGPGPFGDRSHHERRAREILRRRRPLMLPRIARHPLSLLRCPSGIDGDVSTSARPGRGRAGRLSL